MRVRVIMACGRRQPHQLCSINARAWEENLTVNLRVDSLIPAERTGNNAGRYG